MVPSSIDVPGAAGNNTTCTIQGLMILLFAAASVFYNVELAIFYLLIVRYDYSDDSLRKLEPWFLVMPLLLSGVISIPGLFVQVYNFEGTSNCYISASPYKCDEMDSIECDRGEPYAQYQTLLCAFLLILSGCIIIFSMALMYATILEQDRSNDQFRFSSQSSVSLSRVNRVVLTQRSSLRSSSAARPTRNLSNTMRSQGLWYSGAFLFSFLPEALSSFSDNYYFHIFVALTVNMIGFSNALIYVRPRFLKFRRDYPNVRIILSFWHVLCRTRPRRMSGCGTCCWSLQDSLQSMKNQIMKRIPGMSDESNEVPVKEVEPLDGDVEGRRKSFVVSNNQQFTEIPVGNNCQTRREEQGRVVGQDAQPELTKLSRLDTTHHDGEKINFDVAEGAIDLASESEGSVLDKGNFLKDGVNSDAEEETECRRPSLVDMSMEDWGIKADHDEV